MVAQLKRPNLAQRAMRWLRGDDIEARMSSINTIMRESTPAYTTDAFERGHVQYLTLLEGGKSVSKAKIKNVSLAYDEDTTYGGAQKDSDLSERDRKEMLLQAYLHNPFVSASAETTAMRLVSGGPAVQEVVKGKGNKGNHDMLASFLETFSDQWDFRQFFYSVALDLRIFGECYAEIVYSGSQIVKLDKIDCITMTYSSDRSGKITAYHQRLSNGDTQDFKPEEIIRWWYPHPRSNVRSIAPAEKLVTELYTFEQMKACQVTMLRRGVRFTGWMDFDCDDLDEGERRKNFFVENATGPKNHGSVLFTYGGTKFTDLGKGPIDADFRQGTKDERDAILSVLGVSPAMIGIIETGNIGGGTGESQEEAFLRNTVDPLRDLIFEKFNYQITRNGFGITDWKVSTHYADYRDKNVVTQIQDRQIRNGTKTIDEARQDLGGEPYGPQEGGDVPIFAVGKEVLAVKSLGTLAQEHDDAVTQQKQSHAVGLQGLQAAQQAQQSGQQPQGAAQQQQPPQQGKPGQKPPSDDAEEDYTDGSLKAIVLERDASFFGSAASGGNLSQSS
jgi:HK97 family phage portal protein